MKKSSSIPCKSGYHTINSDMRFMVIDSHFPQGTKGSSELLSIPASITQLNRGNGQKKAGLLRNKRWANGTCADGLPLKGSSEICNLSGLPFPM
jgi:hypothetical protein